MEDSLNLLHRATNGQIDVEMFNPGSIVGDPEVLPAVGDGILDMAFISTADFDFLDPGFKIYYSMPGVWTDMIEGRTWFDHFGGRELMANKVAEYNVKLLDVAIKGSEGIWSRRSLATLDDFKGLKVRMGAGIAHDLLTAVGAKPVDLPAEELYTALDTGVVDAGEFGLLEDNWGIGLQEVTDYAYWPSWHNPMCFDLIAMNMDNWNALSDDHKAAIMLFSVDWANRHFFYTQAGEVEYLPKILAYPMTVQSANPADTAAINELSINTIKNEYAPASAFATAIADSVFSYKEKLP
jgi:TRAP-type mannitol/chloroaromatic compound transport system substrate-binding protein